jgi:hypothetical protein
MTKSRGILPARRFWSSDELDQLHSRYRHEPSDVIATDMGRTVEQVYNKAWSLGLKKSDEYMASDAACRLHRGDNVGMQSRFKPGKPAWNRGTRFNAGGRSAETHFQPGQAPSNILPVGFIRTNGDGYLDIKTAPGARKWVPLHRWNWMQAHGDYPAAGMALIFKDGNRLNCDITNLELVTRAELMKKNTVHNLPKELVEVIQLRGAIHRQINQRNHREQ